jgi:hypothetical protein
MEPQGRRGDRQASAAAVRDLGREVGRLRSLIEDHRREHERAEAIRDRVEANRRSSRRYWVSTIALILSGNLATLLTLAITHGHA